MNEISLAEAFAELRTDQEHSPEDLVGLGAYYRLPESASYEGEARCAQSIITRGEAQLFGLSIPRFAIRIRLRDGLGFLNCRRLRTFVDQLYRDNVMEWGRQRKFIPEGAERNEDIIGPSQVNGPLSEVIKHASCIADSLLSPPAKLLTRQQFKFIDISSAQLPLAYGEKLSTDKSYFPFLRSFNLGGGLCSQSVCFMATVALAHHADFVCGIPEITAFAHKDTCAELTLTGLSPGMMDGYFKKIGLRCTEQVLSEDQGLSHFTKAIRAYIDSGFPVILPVDQCRLVFGGKEEASVFKDNGISFEGRLENIAHAVLVIGYGVSSDSPFVFQDPAAMPFMVGTAKQLGEAGPVYPNSQNPDNGVIMPVTPAAIRLPLLQERFFSDDGEAKERQILTGLFVMAARFRGAFKFIHSDQPEGALGKFQLLQLPAQPGVETIQKDAARPKFVDLDQYLNRLLAIYGYEQRWVWVEIFDDAIWVWDAEATPRGALPVGESARDELFTSIGSFLVGVIFWDPNASQIRIKPETD